MFWIGVFGSFDDWFKRISSERFNIGSLVDRWTRGKLRWNDSNDVNINLNCGLFFGSNDRHSCVNLNNDFDDLIEFEFTFNWMIDQLNHNWKSLEIK